MKVTMNWFDNFGVFLPNLLVALVILVVGWLIAFIVSKLVEGLLHRTDLDNRLSRSLKGGQPERLPIERWIALAVFWIIMLFVIVAFLNRLDLGTVSTP
jgi:small-conductance mechanosensitive channel